MSRSLDQNWVALWWDDWVSCHNGWTLLLFRPRVMYAAVQALFCMTAWVLHLVFSDIDIISISVQRFSEILRASMTIRGSSWPKHF